MDNCVDLCVAVDKPFFSFFFSGRELEFGLQSNNELQWFAPAVPLIFIGQSKWHSGQQGQRLLRTTHVKILQFDREIYRMVKAAVGTLYHFHCGSKFARPNLFYITNRSLPISVKKYHEYKSSFVFFYLMEDGKCFFVVRGVWSALPAVEKGFTGQWCQTTFYLIFFFNFNRPFLNICEVT